MSKRDKADDWMPFFVGDYLADTTHLSRDQHGAYLLLLFAGWKKGGRLPDKDEQLANIAKATPKEWRALRPVMEPFFVVEDGSWIQKRLVKEHAGASERKAKSKAKAALGAAARWGKPVDNHASSNPPRNASSMPEAMPGAMPKQCPPPLSLSTVEVNPTVLAPTREQGNGGHKNGPQNQKHAAWRKNADAAAKFGASMGVKAIPGESTDHLVSRIDEEIGRRSRLPQKMG